MDPIILSVITYLTIILGVWAACVVAILGRIMYCARKVRGKIRTTDIALFVSTLFATITAFIVVFIWPGLIHMVPSTVAFVGVGSIPILAYLTELGVKHWIRLRKTIKPEVDEHTII